MIPRRPRTTRRPNQLALDVLVKKWRELPDQHAGLAPNHPCTGESRASFTAASSRIEPARRPVLTATDDGGPRHTAAGSTGLRTAPNARRWGSVKHSLQPCRAGRARPDRGVAGGVPRKIGHFARGRSRVTTVEYFVRSAKPNAGHAGQPHPHFANLGGDEVPRCFCKRWRSSTAGRERLEELREEQPRRVLHLLEVFRRGWPPPDSAVVHPRETTRTRRILNCGRHRRVIVAADDESGPPRPSASPWTQTYGTELAGRPPWRTQSARRRMHAWSPDDRAPGTVVPLSRVNNSCRCWSSTTRPTARRCFTLADGSISRRPRGLGCCRLCIRPGRAPTRGEWNRSTLSLRL